MPKVTNQSRSAKTLCTGETINPGQTVHVSSSHIEFARKQVVDGAWFSSGHLLLEDGYAAPAAAPKSEQPVTPVPPAPAPKAVPPAPVPPAPAPAAPAAPAPAPAPTPPAPAPAAEQPEDSVPPRLQLFRDTMAKLDVADRTLWTENGSPNVMSLNAHVPEGTDNFSAEERDELWKQCG